ncbi:MAG: GspE/PulE family protein [bacterium]
MSWLPESQNLKKKTLVKQPLPLAENKKSKYKNAAVLLSQLLKSPASKSLHHLIDAPVACQYKIIPLGEDRDRLQIATMEPDDLATLDELKWLLKKEIEPLKANAEQIEEALRHIYGLGAETVHRMLNETDASHYIDLTADYATDLEQQSEEASIVAFVNELLIESFQERATDIHIEPYESRLRIRYRVDGVLYEVSVPESLQHLHPAIVSRIKIMANLNIAEQRLPQDGRIKVRTGQQELDLRISILPTPFGESVNIRILNSNHVALNLESLGLMRRDLILIEQLLEKPHGIILVTGPTGSGKTTTLYSCLNKINDSARKIITVEDPIEYQLTGISQVQVNPKIGLTFAQGLRSMLRHDPDVMLVGEIRDNETAEVTIQVAMTGHLVFSTLHTNDAASAVARLINMGIEPYLIAASVECIVAQRLVRVICTDCKKSENVRNGRQTLFRKLGGGNHTLYRGRGCEMCKQSGYFGRTAIYEFMKIDDEIREQIVMKTPANQLRKLAIEKGMVSLRNDGIEKISRGITTLDEVLRVTQEVEK